MPSARQPVVLSAHLMYALPKPKLTQAKTLKNFFEIFCASSGLIRTYHLVTENRNLSDVLII